MFKEKVKSIAREVFESFGNTSTGLPIGIGGVVLGVIFIESNPTASIFNTVVGTAMVTMVYIKTYTESIKKQLESIKKQLDSIEEKINHKTML